MSEILWEYHAILYMVYVQNTTVIPWCMSKIPQYAWYTSKSPPNTMVHTKVVHIQSSSTMVMPKIPQLYHGTCQKYHWNTTLYMVHVQNTIISDFFFWGEQCDWRTVLMFGWRHSWDIRLLVSRCGVWILIFHIVLQLFEDRCLCRLRGLPCYCPL